MNPDKLVQIVLIGASRSGKSSSGNTILGKKLFKTEASAKSVTVSCDHKAQFINGLKVTVVDTPGWDCTEIPEAEVKSQIRQTLQSLQGPYSFLLVLRVGAMESKDIHKICSLQNLLGHSYLDHTTILFTHSDNLKLKTSEEFLSEGEEEFQGLLKKCSNRCYFWNNRNRRSDENVEKILQDLKETEVRGFQNKMSKMDETPSSSLMDFDEKGNYLITKRKSQASINMDAQISQNIRVLFLGMTNLGKTSSVETLVGKCGENSGALNYTCPKSGLNLNLELIESPGFEDSAEQIQKTISKSLSDCAPGPHVIILVMSIGCFSPATKRIMKHVQDSLGYNGSKHTMILFTREDVLEGKPITTYISENQDLSELVKFCGSKFHVFSNRNISDRTQVEELLQKISEIYKRNTGEFYTNKGQNPDSNHHEGPGLDTWRFVLLGKTGVGKSATGNTILGEKVFKSEVKDMSVTVYCNAQTRVVNQRPVTVMDTPGLYDTKMSNDFVIKEIVRGLQEIAPGPHAFLLVIDVKRFTAEEKNTVEHLQALFGSEIYKHMIVIFTRGDDLEYDNKTPEQFVSEAGPDLKQLISACGHRYHVFNNRTKDHTQVQNFLEKISTMLSLNNSLDTWRFLLLGKTDIGKSATGNTILGSQESQCLAGGIGPKAGTTPTRAPIHCLDTWRFVLLGKTGVGKSATGNTILGERVFISEIRDTSVTTKCNTQTRVVNQRRITVMDTPGLYDTQMSNDFVIKEIVHGLQEIASGPLAFLLVIDVRRFTDKEKNIVRHLQELFGDDVQKHMIVLFTHGDDLEYDNKTPEQFVSEAEHDLQQLIFACGNRYHVFNNRSKDRTQVQKLLEKISIMLRQNNVEYYNYGLFKQAQEVKEQMENSKERDRRIAELEAQVSKLQRKNSHKPCSIQ